jgi:hypothetical protein
MMADEAFNRKALAETTLRITGTQGADVGGAGALKLRGIIRELDKQFPKTKRLQASRTASEGVVEATYVQYGRLSLDAVHCSVTALGRHLSTERTDEKTELVLSVVPRTPPSEVLSTVLHACRALTGAAVVANEIVGHTKHTATLAGLMAEFEVNGWQHTP